MKGRVLVVAGSDSGGGAGIQADIKTVTALGGYAATALTALTAQNTEGVFAIHDVSADFVARQMRVVLSDIGADCVKTGMLHRAPCSTRKWPRHSKRAAAGTGTVSNQPAARSAASCGGSAAGREGRAAQAHAHGASQASLPTFAVK